MYIYLAERDDFSKVPTTIMTSLGNVEFAMELELGPERKLARDNPEKVLHNLRQNGFHLQLPPPIAVERQLQALAAEQAGQ